jgi:hypothetical protein
MTDDAGHLSPLPDHLRSLEGGPLSHFKPAQPWQPQVVSLPSGVTCGSSLKLISWCWEWTAQATGVFFYFYFLPIFWLYENAERFPFTACTPHASLVRPSTSSGSRVSASTRFAFRTPTTWYPKSRWPELVPRTVSLPRVSYSFFAGFGVSSLMYLQNRQDIPPAGLFQAFQGGRSL